MLKKVMVGSGIGLVAMTIYLFNAQKMPAFSGEITTSDQLWRLDAFLVKHFFAQKTFYLDAMICQNAAIPELETNYFNGDFASIALTNKSEQQEDPERKERCRMSFCAHEVGDFFYFPREAVVQVLNSRNTTGACRENGYAGLHIKGYFRGDIESGGLYGGSSANFVFDHIPDEKANAKND